MEEIWRDVKGYEGFYQVSNIGRVRSIKRKICTKGHVRYCNRVIILKQRESKKGYYYVELCKDLQKKGKFIQTLVAEVFIPNPNNLPIVNHKSEDKHDNRVENLEWCTYTYNNSYGSLAAKIEAKKKPVIQYTTTLEFVKRYPSMTAAAKENGFSIGNICLVCKGVWKTAYGFVWKYEKED